MGQYYQIINVTKNEVIQPHDFDNGAKLLEWAYTGNPFVNALYHLLADRWKGDKVYVVGDYANATDDPDEIWVKPYKEALDALGIDDERKDKDGCYMSLYNYAGEHMENIGDQCKTEDHDYRYVICSETGEYIDREHLPIEWVYIDEDADFKTCSIDPLPLMLAMGNNRGGGDYYDKHPGFNYVGTWCRWSDSIVVAKELPKPKELCTDFTEHEKIIPYTERDAQVEEYKEKRMLTLWKKFVAVPVDDNYRLMMDCDVAQQGTDKFEVWKWFDKNYEGGVRELIRKELSHEG